jgi:methyl-accepting chemotaxis protein
MFSTWTFGRKVGTGFAVTVLALLIIAVVGYRSTSTLIDNAAWVSHTVQVRAEIAKLLASLVDCETSQRGFVISQREDFLTPYTRALPQVEEHFDKLRELTRDNANQQETLRALEPELVAKREFMRDTIEKVRGRQVEAALAETTSGVGNVTMIRIRELIAKLDAEEVALLTVREREAAASAGLALTSILGTSIGALLLTLVIAWLIISSLSRQIGGAVRDVRTSSTELQTAARQQASSASEQASAMAEVATTMSELLATSRQIADSAHRVSQIAGETASTARLGASTVTRGNDASSAAKRQVEQIVVHMVDLGRKSQQVGAVLDIVSELAEQTNILAVNATIEAAGAGDAGRRFGVVAEEIRNLADRVAASTKEIRVMVDDVRGAVNTTVMATEAGSKAVDTGAAVVAEVAESFARIASLVATTTEASREIEMSTKQQSSAVEQVNVAITSVAQTTRENEASASQTLQTAGQLSTLSGELLKIVQSGA